MNTKIVLILLLVGLSTIGTAVSATEQAEIKIWINPIMEPTELVTTGSAVVNKYPNDISNLGIRGEIKNMTVNPEWNATISYSEGIFVEEIEYYGKTISVNAEYGKLTFSKVNNDTVRILLENSTGKQTMIIGAVRGPIKIEQLPGFELLGGLIALVAVWLRKKRR